MIIIHTNAHLRAQTRNPLHPRLRCDSKDRPSFLHPPNPYCKKCLCFFSFSLCLPESSSCCCRPTAKDKGEKKLFGYSFVPLMQEDGRTLPDGTHELIIHKVFNIKNNIKIIQ